MNAATIITPDFRERAAQRGHEWNWRSGVLECRECEGAGAMWNGHGTGHGNDPDSWDVECRDCEGHGHYPCEVCGFDVRTKGYDCLVCDTVDELTADEVAAVDAAALADAMAKAVDARQATVRRLA